MMNGQMNTQRTSEKRLLNTGSLPSMFLEPGSFLNHFRKKRKSKIFWVVDPHSRVFFFFHSCQEHHLSNCLNMKKKEPKEPKKMAVIVLNCSVCSFTSIHEKEDISGPLFCCL